MPVDDTFQRAVGWDRDTRRRHGPLLRFLKRQPRLWVSGGLVGTRAVRDWSSMEACGSLQSLRAVEFFAGVGGMRAAFEEACVMQRDGAGVDSSRACSSDASGVLRRPNLDNWISMEGSHLANSVNAANFAVAYPPLLPQDVRLLTPPMVDHADLWLLSPPCQPYTRVGKKLDVQDKRAAPLLHLIEVLPELERPPEAIFLENVVGFDRSESWRRMSAALAARDYEVRQFHLSPLQLGIPNRRPRFYALARQSPGGRGRSVWGREVEGHFPDASCEVSSGRPLSEFLDDSLEWSSAAVPKRLLERVSGQGTRPGGRRWEVVDPSSLSSSTFTSGYGRDCPEAPRFGPLLSRNAAGQGDLGGAAELDVRSGGRVVRAVHPDEDVRFFTSKELVRLFGFPPDFAFPSELMESEKYKLIGDSINVKVVAHLLKYLVFEWSTLARLADNKL
eukprot:TRINITY_DN32946_c2_g1_i3.p1 TRINITY_DN32946_c2_g1~~TRINITY_DN32946_c2_g1_i3.p1  ORF type:complete len:447 (+),score=81.88 TRINITY_DN32946_c2_g1_i3:161-1501(+)